MSGAPKKAEFPHHERRPRHTAILCSQRPLQARAREARHSGRGIYDNRSLLYGSGLVAETQERFLGSESARPGLLGPFMKRPHAVERRAQQRGPPQRWALYTITHIVYYKSNIHSINCQFERLVNIVRDTGDCLQRKTSERTAR